MNKNVDPIQILRDFILKSKKIKMENNELVFGNIKLPTATPTAWTSSREGIHYSLGSLWFYLTNKDLDIRSYLAEAMKANVDVVSRPDQEAVSEYFFGKIDKTDRIDQAFHPQTLIDLSKKGKESTSGGAGLFDTPVGKTHLGGESSSKGKEHEEHKMDLRSEKEKCMDIIFQQEKKIATRHSQLLGPKNLIGVLMLVPEKLLTKKRKTPEEIKQKAAELGITYSIDKNKRSRDLLGEILRMKTDTMTEGRPIIVVPKTLEDGNICLYNAEELLGKGVYVNPSVAKKDFSIKYKNEIVTKVFIKHKIRGKDVVFEIREDVTKNHWNRIVGVFLLGPEWQFKDWPVKEKPVTLFLKIRAFYLKYQDSPAHQNIANWNVKTMQINRERRYLDQGVQTEFWVELEKFISLPRVK